MKKKALPNVAASGGLPLTIFQGIFYACIFSLVLLLMFSVLMSWLSLSESLIPPVTTAIKLCGVIFGVLMGMRGKDKKDGWLKGLMIGIGFIAISFAIFCLIESSFNPGIVFLTDLIMGGVCGTLCGILLVNIRK